MPSLRLPLSFVNVLPPLAPLDYYMYRHLCVCRFLTSLLQQSRGSSDEPSPVHIKLFYTGYGSANSTTFNACIALHLNKLCAEASGCCEGVCTLVLGRPNLRSEILDLAPSGVYCCCHERVSSVCQDVCNEGRVPFFKESLADATLADTFCGR